MRHRRGAIKPWFAERNVGTLGFKLAPQHLLDYAQAADGRQRLSI